MPQEDKELLLKDLCARLPYGVICKDVYAKIEGKLSQIGINYDMCLLSDDYGKTEWSYIPNCKPYLFPLSSMTEEQMEELEELCNMYTPDDDYHPYAYKGIKVLYKHVLDDNYKFNFKIDVIDWFNKNHFDYRGLIEKGLAIDATGLNIY